MRKLLIIVILISASILFAFKDFSTDPALVFLNALNDEQRKMAQFPFDDSSRMGWHFFPGAMFPRQGIQLHQLNPSQKELLFELLKVSLSESGYNKTMRIIDLENILAEMDGNTNFRDSEKYYAAFYGDPGKDALWGWSFEGHHISLNFSVLNDKISIAPRFMGASPATIRNGPRKGERTLYKEEDYGFKLINSLSAEQQLIAIFKKVAYPEIVTSNSTEVAPLMPVGIKMEALTEEQHIILISLLNEYISSMPKELADKRMNNIRAEEFNAIRFGWAGSTKAGKPHYYRIQGKSFLVEFDNVQNGANHIHTVWRDFNGDFGRDLIKEHYEHSHHKN